MDRVKAVTTAAQNWDWECNDIQQKQYNNFYFTTFNALKMKPWLTFFYFVWLGASSLSSPLQAQTRIYRCGNEYTAVNSGAQCQLFTGGNITIVHSQAMASQAPVNPSDGRAQLGLNNSGLATPLATGSESPGSRAVPLTRQADARSILLHELQMTQARLSTLRQEYNQGEPQRMGEEFKNYQKYLDRVAQLQSAIARAEADLASIQRELSRSMPVSSNAR